ncbi:hypothetical protein, partial [Bacillus thuringiensis]|uniref:hypothetical protein n=1 Tax=Bacillus thuringiensis TaxID=1428 RepID=UPI0030190182
MKPTTNPAIAAVAAIKPPTTNATGPAIAGLVVGFKKLWQTNEGFKNSISSVIGSIQGFINVL